VTDALPDDPATARVVEAWVERAFAGFQEQGLEPAEVVTTLPEPFNGLESVVRNRSTRLTELVADAMLHTVPGADLSIYNSGSLRLDDILPAGVVTQYDVIRVLPFGGDVVSVAMSGGLVDSVLTQGRANQGAGGFLHASNATAPDGRWMVGGEPLEPGRTYRVATSAFLITGREANLSYFTPDNPSLTELGNHGDVRLAVIEELKRRYGGQ
jgi:5'-nucleotidase